MGVGIARYSGSYGLSCGLPEVPAKEGLLASAPPELLPARSSQSRGLTQTSATLPLIRTKMERAAGRTRGPRGAFPLARGLQGSC